MKTIESLLAFWAAHGTKALGALATLFAGLQVGVAVMGDQVSPSVVGWIAGINAALGAWTVKRGFTNSANQPPTS